MFSHAVTLAIVTLLCIGTADFVRKLAMDRSEPVAYYLGAESVVLLLWLPAIAFITRQGGALSLRGLLFSLISGTLLAVGLTSFFLALGSVQASISVPIARMGLAMTALLALVFLGEPPTPRKLLGIGFAGLAVWLLSR
jgi:uncharacterized membrane protein